MGDPQLSDEVPSHPHSTSDATSSRPRAEGVTRRDIIREGLKVAFVAPVVTTFFARDAVAAGSNHSCYPEGHACSTLGNAEPCCDGLTCQLTDLMGPQPEDDVYECRP